jgi:rhodanese-related sulfurtransferase
MSNLGLPHPKQIDVAVPANLKCGRSDGREEPAVQTWAPLTMTFAGIHELHPASLEECFSCVQLVDVRDASEWSGPLGHIESAKFMPLGELAKRAGELDREKPIVTVCRSGARSAQAVVILQRLGFKQVANLAGGMIRWRAMGLAATGAQE